MIAQAIDFTMKKHEGQFRMGGDPYYKHPIQVMNILIRKGITKTAYLLTALFHDLLEDTDATDKEILDLGNKRVLNAVKLLTKTEGYDMHTYIEGIKSNLMARMIKLADRLHNLLSAVVANKKFQLRYIKETERYYLDLAKGTVFEDDINNALNALKRIAHD
ncbi:MAG: HD domain-containing protein [Solibacillus isronensis]